MWCTSLQRGSLGPFPGQSQIIRRERCSCVVRAAVNHDPEGLFKGIPQGVGLIERKLMNQRMETDKEFAKAVSLIKDEVQQQAMFRRESRVPPPDNEAAALVEYFLDTMSEDMEYEVARFRPRLDTGFFKELDNMIGSERFLEKPNEERLAELETLRTYLEEAVAMVDKTVSSTSSAVDRMKKLLSAPDKKATILEMAAANEIDQALMDLLTQNIDAARAAEQEDAAKFMEKVKQAAAKYLVTPA